MTIPFRPLVFSSIADDMDQDMTDIQNDDANDGEWMPQPIPQQRLYGSGGYSAPQLPPPQSKSLLQRFAEEGSKIGHGALQFGKDFLTDLNVVEPGISNRERLFRAANVGSFFLPPLGVGRTASLGVRMAMKALETGAVTGGLSAIRGTPIVPSAIAGAGLGGALEFALTKGRHAFASAGAAASEKAFAESNPATFSHIPSSPVTNAEWSVLSGQLTDKNNIALTPEKNAMLHAQLGEDIKRLGYNPIEVNGFGPNQQDLLGSGSASTLQPTEAAWLTPGMKRKDAFELAKTYGQSSFMSHEGLFDLDKAEFSPVRKSETKFGDQINKSGDYYTSTPHGDFSMSLDEPIGVSNKLTQPMSTPEEKIASLFNRDPEDGVMDKVLNLPIKTKLDSWYTKVVRSFHGLEQLEKALGAPATERATTKSASQMAQLLGGATSYAQVAYESGVRDWADRTKTLTPGLKDILSRLNAGEFQTFEHYGLTRYITALEDRDYNLPMLANGERLSRADADTFVRETDAAFPHMRSVFDDTVKWHNELMTQTLVKSGVIGEELGNAILAVSKDQVPLRWSKQTREAHAGPGQASTSTRTVAGIDNPLGRVDQIRRQLEPWLHGMIEDSHNWSKLGAQQDVFQLVLQELEKNDPSAARMFAEKLKTLPPEMSGIQTEVIALLKQTDPALAKLAELKGEEMSSIFAPSRLAAKGYIGGFVPETTHFTYKPGFDPALGDVGGVHGPSETITPEAMTNALERISDPARRAEFSAKFDEHTAPKKVWYKLLDTPGGNNMAEFLSGLTPADMSVLTKLSAGVASTLRAGATLSLEFMARNPAKDIPHAFVIAGTHPLALLKGFAHVLRRDDVLQTYLASGGGRASMVTSDRQAMRIGFGDAIGEESRTPMQRLSNVILSPLHALQAFSDILETGTRVGVYDHNFKDLVNNGILPAEATRQAALASRNATVDFGVHGSRTNSVRMITAFWNAQIQGYDNLVRAFKNDPAGSTGRALAAITLPSVLLYLHNREDPEYFKLPDWERNMFWHVKMPSSLPWLGDKWMRFPKPFDLGYVFGSSAEKFLEYLDGTDRTALDSLAGQYLSKNIGDMAPVPTVLRPLIENFANYSFLRNRPVESRATEDVAPEYHIQPGTSQFAIAAGKFFGYSPVKIDNAVSGYLGGLGRVVTDLGDAAINVTNGAPIPLAHGVDPRDFPGVRGLVSQFPRQAESVDALYKTADDIRQAEYTRTNLRKTMQFDDLADWLSRKSTLLGASAPITAMLAQMKNLREMRDRILRDKTLTSTDRANQLDSLSQAMIGVADAAEPIISAIKEQK